MPGIKWFELICFKYGNPISGQMFGYTGSKIDCRNIKINRAQETHLIKVKCQVSNELSRYFFHKVPETLFTDGRTEERLADVRVNPGGRLNKKDGLTRYGDSHVKDKTVSPTVLSLTWKSPYVDKTVFILRRAQYTPIPPTVERRYNELKPGNTYIHQGNRLSSLNRCYLVITETLIINLVEF